ncbi:MAG: cyclic nucleotide-binding domain-containing protein [Candidatus Rifleibacteriota bacterium]
MDFTQIDLFQSLTSQELHEVNKIAKAQQFGRGEIIFQEGAFERNIYIIETGQVEIYKRNPVHGEQTIALLKNGDYFGEMAFFEKTASRSASARATQASNIVTIEGNAFERLLHSHPSISLKLLSTLSQRLRETNRMVGAQSPSNATPQAGVPSGKVLTIASAKSGYGKTTFAAVLAKILCHELNKKILYIDMDLYFAGATQIFGLHSPKTILDINKKFKLDESKFDLTAETVRVLDNLHVVPGPRTFMEAEQVHADDLSRVIRLAKKSYDYIIIDTGSNFDEKMFTALDTADVIFFLLNFASLSTITDNVRFFQGITKLNYPREKLILLASNINSEFSTAKTSKIFPFPIIGGLPRLAEADPQYGKTAFENNPKGPYCEMLRLLVRQVLRETSISKPQGKSGFLSMIFGDRDPEQAMSLQLDELYHVSDSPFSPVISANDVRSQVKYIRYNMMFGYLDEARDHLLKFMEFSSNCAPLLELLGEIMLINNENSQAIEALQKAINIDPEQHLALGYLGALTGNYSKVEEAIKIVKQKIEKNPKHLDLVNDLGKILFKSEKYAEAKAQFDMALQSNPNYLDAKINLAKTLAHLQKSDQAIELLLGIENKNPRIFFVLGDIFYMTGRMYLAFRSYNKAAKLYPSYPGMHGRLAELNNYIQRLETLIDLHERFVNNNPNFPDLHAKLGNFYHLAGKSELAIEEFNKSLKLNPQYQYAALKLEAVQKDMIWRLAKSHVEDSSPENSSGSKEMTVNVYCECKKLKNSIFPDDTVMQIKNVRTAKVMQKAITASQIDQGFARIDCKPLGLIAPEDILIFQVFDIKSKRILRFEPHYITQDEIAQNSCDVRLSIDLTQEFQEDQLLPKYFLVHLDSKQFADIISGEDTLYRAYLKNQANGLETVGHINPENQSQYNAPRGQDIFLKNLRWVLS